MDKRKTGVAASAPFWLALGWSRRILVARRTMRGLVLVVVAVVSMPFTGARAQDMPGDVAAPAWLEPRGLSVVDLVGSVPEAMLRDSMVTYAPGAALAFYESGTRNGNTVRINVRFASGKNNAATCLGMPGDIDAWPTVMPAGTLRILSGNTDVTKNIIGKFELLYAGLTQPSANATGERYPRSVIPAEFDQSGALVLPANYGCKLFLQNSPGPLRGEFTFQTAQFVRADVLGSQSMQFHSYIGIGYSGALASLQDQMLNKFGGRHEDLKFSAPAGTEYVWVKYPATPVAPWDVNSPAGGTYRIRRSDAKLSVDHVNSMGLPLFGQWLDSGQAGNVKFLPYFTNSVAISSLEYFVPAGIGYDPCMTNGGCSDALLQRIHDAEMTMTVYYFTVSRVRTGLQEIPLAAVGNNWSPGDQPFAAGATSAGTLQPARVATVDGGAAQSAADNAGAAALQADVKLYMPIVAKPVALPPDNPTGCPCGWFVADGRMVDFVNR